MSGGGVLGAPRHPALKLEPRTLLVVAAALRFVAAWTHVSWSHPDEWHQTVELAGILLHRWGSWTNEVSLHLRNLLWPAALTLPMEAAHLVAPTSPRALFVAIQLFCGLLDLGRVWGMWVCMEEATHRLRIPHYWRAVGAALILAPAFWIADSVRPSSEHLAVILTWVALALAARGRWFGTGLAALGIVAAKYSAGVLAAGLLAWGAVLLARRVDYRALAQLGAGALTGALLGGLPDAVVYGRPWESLWMYLQYNLLTDLAEAQFGRQGLEAYWDFVGPRWFRWQAFLMAPLAAGALLAVRRAWRDCQAPPYAGLVALYLAVFAILGHKEPRFMAPLESLWVFLGWMGLASSSKALTRSSGRRIALAAVGAAAGLVNLALGLGALWGELGKINFNLLEVRAHLDASPNRVCAVVTSARVPPQLLRMLPPVGLFPADRNLTSFAQAGDVELIWGERAPRCEPGERLLLQTHKPDVGWTQAEGCRILPTGWMRLLPEARARKLNQSRALSGLWLDCPAEALNRFEKARAERAVATAFGRLPALPPAHASPAAVAAANPEVPYPGGCAWFCR